MNQIKHVHWRQPALTLLLTMLLLTACVATGEEPAAPAPTPTVGEALAQDAAYYAEEMGISLAEAIQRMRFQETIGDIQPALQADLPDSYAGLWIQHEPDYRIIIALTKGDERTIQPYIEDKAWADYVEVRPAVYSLNELMTAQSRANEVARALNLAVSSAVDVRGNRVELYVGNPDLFYADLAEAGLSLPESVVLLPSGGDGPLPPTNRGVLVEVAGPGDRTIFLPKQPPAGAYMEALMLGTLIEVDGCLRLAEEGSAAGFLIIWPYDTDLLISGDTIEVVNGAGEIVARVGEPLRLGGGAMESAGSVARVDETVPGLANTGCSGPIWVSGPPEPLTAQVVEDFYIDPFSVDDETLLLFIQQARPSPDEGNISGALTVDDSKCVRVGGYLVLWPPDVYPREDPLRLVDANLETIALIGDEVIVYGAAREPADYRFFENKMICDGPYWGAASVAPAR